MPKAKKRTKVAKERRKYCRCTPICTAKINRKNRIRHYRQAKIPLNEAPPSVTATESGEEGSTKEEARESYGESRMNVDEESGWGSVLLVGDSELEREDFDNGGSEFHNEGLELNNGGSELDNDSEGSEFHNEAMEFHNEGSEFHNEALELNNEALEFHNKGLELNNKGLELNNKGSELNNLNSGSESELDNEGSELDNEGSELDNEGSELDEWKEFDEAAEAGLLEDLSDSDVLSELDLMLESDMLAADEHEAEEWANRKYLLFKDSIFFFCIKEGFHQERNT